MKLCSEAEFPKVESALMNSDIFCQLFELRIAVKATRRCSKALFVPSQWTGGLALNRAFLHEAFISAPTVTPCLTFAPSRVQMNVSRTTCFEVVFQK